MGDPIAPPVTDENSEGKAKNQDRIDHQIEHGDAPLRRSCAESGPKGCRKNEAAKLDTKIAVLSV
jgi:hypothetical protein